MGTRVDWRLRKKKREVEQGLCLPYLLLFTALCAAGLFWLLVRWQKGSSSYLEGKAGLIWLVLPIIVIWSLWSALKGVLRRSRLKRELEQLEEDERMGRRHD